MLVTNQTHTILQVLEVVLDLLALHHNCLQWCMPHALQLQIIVLHALGWYPMVQPQDQVALHPTMHPMMQPQDQASHVANQAIPN